jgi:peptide/nickel transport system ATP-binding protein
MYKGQIVEQGTSKEIFLKPKHPYTKALIACRPALHSKDERLPIVSDFMTVDEQGEIAEKEPRLIKREPVKTSNKLEDTNNKLPVILSVKHLKVYFASKKTFLGKVLDYTKAVDDVSFDVFEGETLGLVGGSGSGKTTLGRSILQLIKPTQGEIFFRGENLTNATPQKLRALRKQLQIIFQDPYSSLNPRKRIGDAIAEPLLVHKVCSKKQVKDKVIALLEKVNLAPSFYYRYPHELSGGQRQRIVIARALALEPSFIICDESLSALDVSVQAQVLNLLNDLKKEFNFTAIFISHDLSVVRYISDRIIVMNQGKIEEIGNAEEVYQNPKSAYTKLLLSAIPNVVID